MNERKESSAMSEEEEFAKQAKALFDESVDAIDASTQSRLNRGRQAALEELERSTGTGIRLGQWAPAAGVAAAAAVVGVMVWTGDQPVDPVVAPAEVSDFELILAEDSFEMLEDLEFYAWIDMDTGVDETDDADGNVG